MQEGLYHSPKIHFLFHEKDSKDLNITISLFAFYQRKGCPHFPHFLCSENHQDNVFAIIYTTFQLHSFYVFLFCLISCTTADRKCFHSDTTTMDPRSLIAHNCFQFPILLLWRIAHKDIRPTIVPCFFRAVSFNVGRNIWGAIKTRKLKILRFLLGKTVWFYFKVKKIKFRIFWIIRKMLNKRSLDNRFYKIGTKIRW